MWPKTGRCTTASSGFEDYGKLSGIDVQSVRAGARVAVDEYEKDDLRDFALWKSAKDVDVQAGAAWDSPWGPGDGRGGTWSAR